MSKRISITSQSPALTVFAYLAEEGATVTGGYGQWQEVSRARRQALTQYVGRSPFTMTVPLILDGYKQGQLVEQDCQQIELMALPAQNGEPPTVNIAGPVPHTELNWVITNITWGPSAMRSGRSGGRIRQAVTIEFKHFVADDRIQEAPAAQVYKLKQRQQQKSTASKRGGGHNTSAEKTYTVLVGDTLISIASRKLGNPKRWHEIAALNGKRDPRSVVPEEQIRLP